MNPPDKYRAAELAQSGRELEDNFLMKFQTFKAQSADVLRQIPMPGSGIGIRQTRDGPIWDIVSGLPGLTVNLDGSVVAATIGGIYPTIEGDSIEQLPTPRLQGLLTGTRYVVVNITGTLNTDGGVYVEGWASIDAVELTVEETAPTAADLKSSAGTFRFTLASFAGGQKTSQNYTGALNLTVCDDQTGTGTAQLFPETA